MDERGALPGLGGQLAFGHNDTISSPSLAPNSTAKLICGEDMEGLIAPLNPRLMVSRMYLTLKGGLRADIKGGGGDMWVV